MTRSTGNMEIPVAGSKLPVRDVTAVDPYLEFSVHAGAAHEAQRRIVAGVFKFRRLEVKTRPRVRVYADTCLVGRTPATVTAEVSAVKVLLPR